MIKTRKSKWNSELYDEAHGFISNYGKDLYCLLAPVSGEKILDAGCATGDLSQLIHEAGAEVIGIDSSADMITRGMKKYPKLNLQVMDILSTPSSFHNYFDGVFSNAVLHWVKETKTALSSFFLSLKSGGRLVAEMGGKDNILTILTALYRALDHFGYPQNKNYYPWVFYSIGEYAPLLESVGFRIRELIYFDRPTKLDHGEKGLRHWLEMFGNVFLQGIAETVQKDIYVMIERDLRGELFRNGHWWADYKRLRVKAEKP